MENIYSCNKRLDAEKKSKSLAKLITNGMDDESIWQQIELKNDESFSKNLRNVSRFLASSTEKFKLGLENQSEDSQNDAEDSDVESNEQEAGENSENEESENSREEEEIEGSEDENL